MEWKWFSERGRLGSLGNEGINGVLLRDFLIQWLRLACSNFVGIGGL
jgi:hypothetical protein